MPHTKQKDNEIDLGQSLVGPFITRENIHFLKAIKTDNESNQLE